MEKVELGFDLDSLLSRGKSNFSNVKTEYVKEGDSLYRLIPPAANATTRELNRRWVTHWITGENGKKSQVQCTYYTEKYCPLCTIANELQKKIDTLTNKGEIKWADMDDATKTEHKRISDAKDQYQATRNFAYLTFNANNEVVVLKMSSTVSQLLDKKIFQAATEYNFDPTALKGGVWFKFTKKGKGRDSVTLDFKRIMTRTPEGKIVEELDQTDLPEDALNKLNSSRPDIHSPKDMWVKEYSAKQLADFLKGIPLSAPAGGSTVATPVAQEVTSAPVTAKADPAAAARAIAEAQARMAASADEETPPWEESELPFAPTSSPAPVVATASVPYASPAPAAAPVAASKPAGAPTDTIAQQIAKMREVTAKAAQKK